MGVSEEMIIPLMLGTNTTFMDALLMDVYEFSFVKVHHRTSVELQDWNNHKFNESTDFAPASCV